MSDNEYTFRVKLDDKYFEIVRPDGTVALNGISNGDYNLPLEQVDIILNKETASLREELAAAQARIAELEKQVNAQAILLALNEDLKTISLAYAEQIDALQAENAQLKAQSETKEELIDRYYLRANSLEYFIKKTMPSVDTSRIPPVIVPVTSASETAGEGE